MAQEMKWTDSGIMGGFSTERLRIPNGVPSQKGNVILGVSRRAPRRPLRWVLCASSAARKRLRAQSVGAGAQDDDDCDRRSLAVLEIAEGYISDDPATTHPNTYESPPSPPRPHSFHANASDPVTEKTS